LQIVPKCHCERVLAAEHAPRDPCHVPERRHCLAQIVERGGGVFARANASLSGGTPATA
jgi:hypothetical protein